MFLREVKTKMKNTACIPVLFFYLSVYIFAVVSCSSYINFTLPYETDTYIVSLLHWCQRDERCGLNTRAVTHWWMHHLWGLNWSSLLVQNNFREDWDYFKECQSNWSKLCLLYNYLFGRQKCSTISTKRPYGYFKQAEYLESYHKVWVHPADTACQTSLSLSSLISFPAPVFIYLSSSSFFSITPYKFPLHLQCRPSLCLKL